MAVFALHILDSKVGLVGLVSFLVVRHLFRVDCDRLTRRLFKLSSDRRLTLDRVYVNGCFLRVQRNQGE